MQEEGKNNTAPMNPSPSFSNLLDFFHTLFSILPTFTSKHILEELTAHPLFLLKSTSRITWAISRFYQNLISAVPGLSLELEASLAAELMALNASCGLNSLSSWKKDLTVSLLDETPTV